MLRDLRHNCYPSFEGLTDTNFGHTATSIVPDDVEMIKRVIDFCDNPKVWVVTQDEVIDCEIQEHEPNTFLTRDNALAFFNNCAMGADLDFTPRGWSKDEYTGWDNIERFLMWDASDCYVNSHYSVSLQAITLE